jgi:hypothetical protein
MVFKRQTLITMNSESVGASVTIAADAPNSMSYRVETSRSRAAHSRLADHHLEVEGDRQRRDVRSARAI